MHRMNNVKILTEVLIFCHPLNITSSQ